jgi:hypothetical protein
VWLTFHTSKRRFKAFPQPSLSQNHFRNQVFYSSISATNYFPEAWIRWFVLLGPLKHALHIAYDDHRIDKNVVQIDKNVVQIDKCGVK